MLGNNPYIAPFAALLAIAFFLDRWLALTTPDLSAIPAAGSTGRISSFFNALRFIRDGHTMIQEGIEKYHSAAFRVSTIGRWTVILSKKSLVNDIRQAREADLSFYDAVDELLQGKYTLGRDPSHYHVEVVRGPLTRNLATRFSDIKDEVTMAFNDNIPQSEGWVSIKLLDAAMQVVVRTSNRLFVGLPLCRNPDYCDLNTRFTVHVFLTALFLNAIPPSFRVIIGPLFGRMPNAVKRARKHLEPLITQRMKDDAELGFDREDRPNDLITWLLDAAPEDEKNVTAITKRVLLVNISAIHTSSTTFTQALLQLAGRPEYINPIRREIESVIEQEGWSRAAMGKLHKLDGFLRECLRWEGMSSISMLRVVRNPEGFTLSDGTHLPQGTHVACAAWDIHHSEENYVNPLEFDGFRFSNMQRSEDESASHQFVSTSPEYIVFGHGRHACPGRFFAANEIKVMLAHVLLNYDVKLEDRIPPTKWFNATVVVDNNARVMFRKRRT